MKIIAFNGSPKSERGNTHIMVEEFLKGAQKAGAECENIFLAKKNIKRCLGCFSCWIKTPGECVIKDDMRELTQRRNEADILVFASPVYVDNITAIMKGFLDRSIPSALPYFEKDENGETRHKLRCSKVPKIVVISNCGYPEQSHFQVLHLLFKRIARNMHSEVIAEIYRGGGEILNNKNIFLLPFIYKYKKLLQGAGREIVENQRLSEKTKNRLERPIISADKYLEGANKYWDKELSRFESRKS